MSKRNNTIAQIHITAKKLGYDDFTLREVYAQVTKLRSLKEMSDRQLGAVRDHLVVKDGNPRRTYPGRPHNTDGSPLLKKIEALLSDMKLPWSYADALAMRMYKIEKVGWLKHTNQFNGVIAALNAKQRAMAAKGPDGGSAA